MMKFLLSCFFLGFVSANNDTAINAKPFGPYYCQARCLASCLETNLAPTLDECTKFCPPFDDNTPCPSEDIECWKTCGVVISDDQIAPKSVSFVPATLQDDLNDNDPYKIIVAWTSSANASLYIIEFYPLDRQSRPGEPNFFRAMTTSLFYAVRKEEMCIAYDAKVIAVNSYGLSITSSIFIGQPAECTNTTSIPEVAVDMAPFQPSELAQTVPFNQFAVVSPISPPGFMPQGIVPSSDRMNTTDSTMIDANIPIPPPLPFFTDSTGQVMPMPPGASVSIIDSQNGSDVQIVQINRQQMLPMCDQDMFDIQPSPNPLTPSLLDLTVTWLERQPLPPLPTPTYFTIRYGPIVRYLVDDGRQDYSILPGYETIVRTGQDVPSGSIDPTRHIDIIGLQQNTLLKFQICAIYDASTEPLIMWDNVFARRVDLAALEPFLELETPLDTSPNSNIMPPGPNVDLMEPSTSDQSSDSLFVPLIISVSDDNDQKFSSGMYWMFVASGIMIVISTATLIFVCLRRTCKGGKRNRMESKEKVIYYVNAQPPPPSFNEVVKVPPV